MKLKTRKPKINEEPESLLQIPEHFKVKCSDLEILQIIIEFNAANIVEEQISSIHKLITFIKTPSDKDEEFILNILVYLFVNSDPKNAVKKTILRSIKKFAISDQLSSELLSLIKNVNTENNYTRFDGCVNSINECFNNFPGGVKAVNLILKDVYEYLIKSLKCFVDYLGGILSPSDLQLFYNYIHTTTRALVAASQQCDNIKTIIPVFIKDLTVYCIKIFNNSGVFFDTKNNCGILLITALNASEENGYISMLQLTLNEIQSTFDVNYSDINDDIVISCIYAGVLNTVDPNKLCNYNEMFEESYIFKISEKLLDISKHSADKPSAVLGVNRALLLVSKALKTLNQNDFTKILKYLLENVWTQLDHYVDSIRHISKSILSNFVKTAISYGENGSNILSYIIDNIFKCLNTEKRAKYVALSVISSEVGCGILLQRKSDLISLIMFDLTSETSSQTYVISCCENLMRQYLKEVDESVWFSNWVTPIITKLKHDNHHDINCEETNLQILLITALKLKPDILEGILEALSLVPAKEIILSTILKCTIAVRKLGSAPIIEDDKKWRNILDYAIIEKAKCDQNDEIRISCLSLIVESHKTTEIFNKFEFDFIISYLHYNINAQEPSTRQRILFLIKKFLTRYTESYYAIIRDYKKLSDTIATKTQQDLETQYEKLTQLKDDYEHFIFHLRVSVFGNLFSRASFARRNNCLEILTMLEPIITDVSNNVEFTPSKIWKEEYVNAVLLCLEDSYEVNQQLATKLLLKAPVEYLKINNKETTKKFIDRALQRMNMVQPAYSQSAAYFFEISLCSPVIVELLTEEMVRDFNDDADADADADATADDEDDDDDDYCKNSQQDYVLIKFLFRKLQEQVKVGKRSLLIAAGKAPMYGTLYCLRHLLDKYLFTSNLKDQHWKQLIAEIIETSFKISEIVGPIVNNSSPEGHLPMDQTSCPQEAVDKDASYEHYASTDESEDEEEEDKDKDKKIVRTVTSQMLLVCAWRSIKEVSLLLGEITLKSTIATETENGLITEEQIYKIGEHFTVLLTETKHRGAFEQAYVGFVKLCTRLWKCKSETLHQLPVTWLNDTISAISNPNEKNLKLCATRRSAGVPFMIQAIVASELQTGGSVHFHRCMKTLLQLANDSGDNIEVRTHSMNILRALFRHTQLGEEIAQYTGEGLIVSIIGFSRKSWAERNSATLLFSSLMTRIFGVQRNKDSDQMNIRNRMTARVFFLRNPTLHAFLLNLIKELTDSSCEPYKLVALYPILLLLARLYPGNNDERESENLLQDFLPFVKLCANNKNLKTRELAAKAILPLVPTDQQKIAFLRELFMELHKNCSEKNYMHGILLQIYYLLPTIKDFEKKFDICKIIKNTSWVLTYDNPNSCAVICALYMKIVSKIIPKSVQEFFTNSHKHKNEEKQKLFEDLFIKLISQDKYVQRNCIVGKSLYNKESTYMQLNLLRFRNYGAHDSTKISNFLIMKMMTQNEDVLEIVLNFMLYYLNELKSSKRSIEFILDSFEIPEQEKNLAKMFAKDFKPDAIYKHLASNLGQKLYTIFEHICANYPALANKAYIIMSFFKKLVLKEGVELAYKTYFSALVKGVTSHNDEQASAIVICMKIIMKNTLSFEFMNDIGLLDHLFEILHECATPRRSVYCRYAVALTFSDEFIARLFLERGHFNIGINNVIMVWKIIMQLSIDPEPIVRNKISELDKSRTIAEKTREIFLDKCINYFRHISTTKLIHLLLYWCISDLEQLNTDEEHEEGQIFEKSETSSYVEDMFVSRLAAQKLSSFVRCETITDFHDVFSRILNILLMEQDLWDVDVDELITIFEDFQKEIVTKTGTDLIDAIKKFVDSHYGLEMHAKIKYICLGILPENFVWEE